ncbi:MAG: (d)CMP kinase [Saprospiraceae bacterium]|nr:(d)CMP kinase [Candidatus Opimibacter skivensis]
MQTGHRKIIIAIDGYSACGKSTLARALAKRLGYVHIDSGAMYRAVTLYVMRHHIDINDADEMAWALSKISIHLSFEHDQQVTWLNHENVEQAIREPSINEFVSNVSTLSAVRKEMVAQQRRMGLAKGIVMDGRDIGTVVFPEADLKLFIIADIDVRTERRWMELQAKGVNIAPDEVKANLLLRDTIDSTREDSPLKQSVDATVIDTSYLTPKEQLQIALDLSRSIIGKI